MNASRKLLAISTALACCLAIAGLTGGPAAAQPKAEASGPAADQIAERIQAFYDKTLTFHAEFKQRYWIKAYDTKKDSRGSVTFEKPGKMSWRYSNNGNRVVSDGKTLKIYEEENKQMYEQSVDKSQYPAALSFLLGGGKLKKEFKFRKLDAKRAKFDGGYVLLGEPKSPTPAYQKLVMYVDKQTSQVRRVMLIDAQGNRNRFDFIKPVVNKKPAQGEFQFQPPRGTKIVKP